MADVQLLITIGLIGALTGCVLRTAWPFLRKTRLPDDVGHILDMAFERKFLYAAAGAFVASAGFYMVIAPLTKNPITELLLGLVLGFAGNDAFNELEKTIRSLFKRKEISA
ncbi:hypothetical protein LCGC14_1697570 [marine sediment metagenome]|uniref:Uncharacterized protein n=1 Tax=marine sediment metagenome TaxID=412755 RepID=A0A0F9HJE2_9ZZZZ